MFVVDLRQLYSLFWFVAHQEKYMPSFFDSFSNLIWACSVRRLNDICTEYSTKNCAQTYTCLSYIYASVTGVWYFCIIYLRALFTCMYALLRGAMPGRFFLSKRIYIGKILSERTLDHAHFFERLCCRHSYMDFCSMVHMKQHVRKL